MTNCAISFCTDPRATARRAPCTLSLAASEPKAKSSYERPTPCQLQKLSRERREKKKEGRTKATCHYLHSPREQTILQTKCGKGREKEGKSVSKTTPTACRCVPPQKASPFPFFPCMSISKQVLPSFSFHPRQAQQSAH